MRPARPVRGTILAASLLLLLAASPSCGTVEAPRVPACDSPIIRDARLAPPPSREEPAGPLTLARALAIAEAENPGLAAREADVGAARGRERQAGLFPNPAISFQTTDGVLHRRPGEAKYIAGISYALPLSGRIGLAQAAAGEDREAVEAQLALGRRALRAEVKSAFAEIKLRSALLELTGRFSSAVAEYQSLTVKRVKTGEGSEAEQQKVEQVQARLELQTIVVTSEIQAARLGLARLLGRSGATLPPLAPDGATETAIAIPELPDISPLRSRVLREHPHILLAGHRWDQARFELSLARRQRIPDVGVFGAAATTPDLRDRHEAAIEGGVQIPIPIFDANEGRIEEAESAVRRAAREADEAANDLLREVDDAHRRLALAIESVRRYRDDIVPDAEDALERARREYEFGRFNVVDLLDGYRTVVEVKTASLEAVRDLAVAIADLERVAGE